MMTGAFLGFAFISTLALIGGAFGINRIASILEEYIGQDLIEDDPDLTEASALPDPLSQASRWDNVKPLHRTFPDGDAA